MPFFVVVVVDARNKRRVERRDVVIRSFCSFARGRAPFYGNIAEREGEGRGDGFLSGSRLLARSLALVSKTVQVAISVGDNYTSHLEL